MMLKPKISKEEIKQLPLWKYDGEIELVEDKKSLERAIDFLSEFPILGFDTEARPTFRKGQYNPICLLQLACDEKVFLIRNRICGFSDSLVKLFENDAILKVGAGIKDDIKDMQYWKPFEPSGFEDLNVMAKSIGLENQGVRNLAALVLGKRVSKNQQTSNWESKELSEHQKLYAATDAWICLEVYYKLVRLKK